MNSSGPDTPSSISRRALIASAGAVAGTAALASLIPELGAQQPAPSLTPPPPVVPDDPSAIPGAASEAPKTVVTDDNTVVMLADFYRQGDGVNESFTAHMFVSAVDEAPDLPGIQNVWIEGVGCGTASTHLGK